MSVVYMTATAKEKRVILIERAAEVDLIFSGIDGLHAARVPKEMIEELFNVEHLRAGCSDSL